MTAGLAACSREGEGRIGELAVWKDL